MSGLWGNISETTVYDPVKSTAARTPSNEMGKDDFLKLLLTQMKYQDPLEPMDNQQSMAQLAQFSALEQMQNVASASFQQQAYGLIGKVVIGESYIQATGEYEQIFGRVDGVKMKNGSPYLVVGEKDLELSGLQSVINNPEEAGQLSLVNSNLASLQSISIVGKNVQGVFTDDKGNPTEYIEGKVDYFKIADGVPVLVIGNKEIRPEQIMTVGDNSMVLGKNIKFDTETADGSQRNEGKIDSISFADGEVFVNVDGTQLPIKNIGDLTKMLSFVGKDITSKNVTGTADYVLIEESVPYLVVADKKVSLSEISKVKDKIN